MKKLIWITTILLIALCAFVSCAQEPSSSEPADNMTDSYRNARQRVHDSSNIWLPQLEGVEIANIEVTEKAKPLVNISFAGDATLFNQLATYLNETIGKEPDMSEETLKWWEIQYTENGQVYVGNISIDLYQGMISLASHFFRGFTVTITAKPAAGGTALIYPGGSNKGVSSLTEAENSDTDLKATPADGYVFAGWYLGDTLISDKAIFWDYKIPSQNVAIEARFTEGQAVQMTDYYATGRQKLIDWNLITLPEIEGLGSEDFTIEEGIGWWTSDADICFDFDSGVTEDAYNAIKAAIEELCGTTQTEGNPRIDYDDENPGQIVQIDNWWAYNGKRYNLYLNIANEGLYFNIIQSN